METIVTKYTYWKAVPKGIKTKTQWLKDGYTVHKSAEPVATFQGMFGKIIPLYTYIQVQKKKQRMIKEPVVLEFTPENIGKCLSELNHRYFVVNGNVGIMSYYIEDKFFLEIISISRLLKNAITKARLNNLVTLVGYHRSQDRYYGCDEFYKHINIGGYQLYIPCDKQIQESEITSSGDINYRSSSVRLCDSLITLHDYVSI